MLNDLIGGGAIRQGHFVFESGYHGDRWMDLEILCLHPRSLDPLVEALAGIVERYRPDAVCGALNEGAFLALLVARRLDLHFVYAERFADARPGGLFPVEYRLPPVLRGATTGKRVAIVNDVISAGSAVRGAHADLLACGAIPVAIAALLVVGNAADRWAREAGIPLERLGGDDGAMWEPAECPLCAAGVPIDTV